MSLHCDDAVRAKCLDHL